MPRTCPNCAATVNASWLESAPTCEACGAELRLSLGSSALILFLAVAGAYIVGDFWARPVFGSLAGTGVELLLVGSLYWVAHRIFARYQARGEAVASLRIAGPGKNVPRQ